MTTAYTSLLGLALPVTGELSGTWGQTVNDSITSLLDSAVAGTTTLSTDLDVTLTTTTGAANTAREAILLCSGARTALRTITAPAQSKIYTIINATTGGFGVKIVGAGPTTGITIAAGESAVIAWNGSDFIKISNTAGAGVFSSITNTGLTSGRVVYSTTGGLETDSSNLTFNGTTLTANTLNLTNALGTAYGGTGLTSFTANGVVYASSTSALTTGSALTFNGTVLGVSYSDTAFAGGFSIKNTATTGAAWARMDFQSGANSSFAIYQQTDGTATLNATGNNAITFSENGSEQMRLTSTGLGIGTSSPAQKLDVRGYATIINPTDTANNTQQTGLYFQTGTTYKAGIQGYRYNGSYEIGLDFFYAATGSGTYTLGMRLDSSGNLGLGVTPSVWGLGKAIEVGNVGNAIWGASAGNMLVAANMYYSGGYKYAATGAASQYQQNAGAHQWFNAASGTAGNAITFTQAMTLDASGNLALGDTSASYRLDVKGSTGNGIAYRDGTVTAYMGTTGSNLMYSGTLTNHPLAFLTNATERARIDSSGNLLVGTTNTDPAGNNVSGVAIRTGATTSIQNGSSTALTLGTSANNTYLQVFRNASSLAGYISVSGTVTTYNSISDYRLKENVQPMEKGLETISQLKPCTYDWILDKTQGKGFIAHELQAVIPEAVQGKKDLLDEDGNPLYQGVDVSMIVPYLVKATQEQQALIESLTTRLAALEAA